MLSIVKGTLKTHQRINLQFPVVTINLIYIQFQIVVNDLKFVAIWIIVRMKSD